ncbi:carbonyl reductase 1 [Microdochium nivale]|nr:carbonyl reductase 1 [Microdochium nivale]
MSKPWIFISPSSRGIGLAVTRHLLRNTALPILATTRSTDTGAAKRSLLDSLDHNQEHLSSRLHVLQLDVTDEQSIQAASERAAELFPPRTHHLHMAFAVPGILHPEKSPKQVDYAGALDTFKINTLGPLMLLKWFGDFLPRKATDMSAVTATLSSSSSSSTGEDGQGHRAQGGLHIPPHATFLLMSARVGSTSDNRLGGWYTYRASKAGVNSIARTYDNYLRARSGARAMAMAYHPGTVKTDFSREFWAGVKEGKLFSPEFAAEKLLEVVCRRDVDEDRGRCWDWKGDEVVP